MKYVMEWRIVTDDLDLFDSKEEADRELTREKSYRAEENALDNVKDQVPKITVIHDDGTKEVIQKGELEKI